MDEDKTFASVTARTPSEALEVACRQTKRSPDNCKVNHAFDGRVEDTAPGASHHFIVADEHGPFTIVVAPNFSDAVTTACEVTGLAPEEVSVQRIDLVLHAAARMAGDTAGKADAIGNLHVEKPSPEAGWTYEVGR